MKKTLVALAVAAFAASSAQAVTVIDADGTKVDFVGSLRVKLDKEVTKTTDGATGASSKSRNNTTIKNAGSRFGVNVRHQLGEDFYALSRLEFRFDETDSTDKWGRIYAKRAYVGLGSHKYGELAFGRQVTIADDLNQAADYEYGIVPKGDYIPTSATSVVRYDYRGIEGLQLSANYNFAQKHKENGSASLLDPAIKNGAAAGALYQVGDLDARVAYGRTNYETGSTDKHHKDGYLASFGYQLGDVKLTGDFGYAHEKDGADKGDKFYVSPGFQYQVIPASKLYGNYLYERVKVDNSATADTKAITHGFLLGVDYKFHKQVVAFVEGKYLRTKNHTANGNDGYTLANKVTDKSIGVGMRVFW